MERPRSPFVLVASTAAVILVVTAGGQLDDTNFYTLWEATAILAGDHPYLDFYEWGVPLQALLSAAMQLLTGHRLIGELSIHWAFIIAGVTISFALGRRLSGSIGAPLLTISPALVTLAATPTFHYPKIFFYPLIVWQAWRYLDRPTIRRAAALGGVTAVAFLFRHDHGVYAGIATIIAFVLARLAVPMVRSVRSFVAHGAAYALTISLLLAPWTILVARSEGLIEYVDQRADLYTEWSAGESPFRALLTLNPVRTLMSGPDRDGSAMWLQQMALFVPILLFATAALDILRRWRTSTPLTRGTWHALLAALFLGIIESRLFREPSYFLVVAPLAAGLGARLFSRPPGATEAILTPARWRWSGRIGRAVVAAALLTTTAMSVAAFTSLSGVVLSEIPPSMRSAWRQLLASPAIDGYQPPDDLRRLDRATWHNPDRNDNLRVHMRYAYECTRPGDRLLVTGSTPYQVGYYANRAIAGGHLFWHHGWRSDSVHEARSLALLERQSVPIVFSTSDPILEDFKRYPNIARYLQAHYIEPPGADGLLLVDTRRAPTGYFEPTGWPCFR